MKNLMKYILIAAIALIFNSCAKDGPTGPQGVPGNANVITYTFTTDSSGWLGFPQTQWLYQYKNLSMDLSGGVEIYWGGYLSGWSILPISANYIAINAGINIDSSTVSIAYSKLEIGRASCRERV